MLPLIMKKPLTQSHKHHPIKMQQKGFILVATIWMLAAATVVAGAFAIWVQRSLELVSQQSEHTKSSLEMISTKSTALYLLATHSKNQAGIVVLPVQEGLPGSFFDPMSLNQAPISGTEVRLDNRPYQGLGTAIFSLQDEAGLININAPSSMALKFLLLKSGLSTKQSKSLTDKLTDYIDEDDFNMAQGAERYHYRQLNLPGPANKKLSSPFELVNVLEWQSFIENNQQILQNLTATDVFLININTTNKDILSSLPGLDEVTADLIIEIRNNKPLVTLNELDKMTGLNLISLYESLNTFHSRHTRLSLWHKNSRLVEQFSIQLTPTSRAGTPWKINNSFSISKSLTHDIEQPGKPHTDIFNSSVSATED